MIREGEPAPQFELPAVVEGEFEPVDLSSYLGRNVVVLAFYPADFNPACEDGRTDLDDLDLFTMQKDVDVIAVSADSLYSHRAFAEEFDLHIPLLADTHGAVAADYGVDVADPTAGYRNHRAVFVVGPEGDVEFAWSTEDLEELPPVEAIRETVDDVGGAETALARYRVGHAHYVEGRRAFTSAMYGFQDEDWMVARSDFRRAYEEFDEAATHFNSAVRFGDDDHSRQYFQLAEDKAELLWQAGDWLAEAANAYASGEGAHGQAVREDAERTLEAARDIFEPPEPDDFPPEEDPAERLEAETDGQESILPGGDEEIDASLDVDLDETEADAGDDAAVDGEASETDPQEAEADAWDDEIEEPARDEDTEDEEEIDAAELEEITAELEEQTEAAQKQREAELEEQAAEADDENEAGEASEAGAESGASTESEAGADDATERGEGEDGATDEDVELDLVDPTGGEGLEAIEDEGDGDGEDEAEEDGEEQEEDEEDDDLGQGGHGVPDSL